MLTSGCDEIRKLAQTLLDDPTVGAVIRGAGIECKFSGPEAKAVSDLASRAEFLNYYDGGINSWLVQANIDLAVAVACKVAVGEFDSVSDPRATTLLQDNWVPPEMTFSQLEGRAIAFDEFYGILKEYIQTTPELPEMIARWGEAYRQGRDFNAELSQAELPAVRIMRRRGLIRVAPFANVASSVLSRGMDYRDKEAVRRLVREIRQSNWHIEGI